MVGQIDDLALILAVDRGVWLIDEITERFRMPMITARIPLRAIHALLDDGPLAIIGYEEPVQVKIVAVLHRGAVDLGDEAACARQRGAVETNPHPKTVQLLRRLARML